MSFTFLDRVAASAHRPRPVFKAYRSRLVMNRDANQAYFSGTDRVLLAYDSESNRLAIKALPPDVYEHEGWQAFRIEPQPQVPHRYQVEWRAFWDREVGRTGGRPVVRGDEIVQSLGDGVVAFSLS